MQVVSLLYLIVLTLGAGLFWSWTAAGSVLVGGLIAITSFMVSKRGLVRLLDTLPQTGEGDEKESRTAWKKSGYLLRFWIRIAIIGVVLLLLIQSGKVNILGLILGLSTIVFTVTFTALSVARHYYFSGRR